MELHNKLEKQSPKLKETKDPAEIQTSQVVLAQKIREARKDSKAGEIFTPEAEPVTLTRDDTPGEGRREERPMVNQPRINLNERGAGIQFLRGILGIHDSPDSDNRQPARG